MPGFQIFDPAQRDSLRKAGKILRECLQHVASHVKPGISTKELDSIAEAFIRQAGGTPAFLGYHGFTGTLCTSINDECVHGIPSSTRMVNDGDIISLDCGVIVDGLYTDACITVPVGRVTKEVHEFLDTTSHALEEACRLVRPGAKIGDISSTVQGVVEAGGYKCVRALTGHGLGDTLHQFPDIPNVGEAGTGPTLPAWTLIAIEPITAMGGSSIKESDDGWTICTGDGSLSAHFEHTVLVTEDGCEILA